MPKSWWELSAPSTAAQFERSEEAAQQFDRALAQLWHYELEQLVHLPFMLRAGTDRRYEYSRLCCLDASRGVIQRWLFIRDKSKSNFACRIVEFQALTASITLLLGHMQPSQDIKGQQQLEQEKMDRTLINSVKQILEDSHAESGDEVVLHSIEVLNTLLSIDLNDCNHNTCNRNGAKIGNLKLRIPHFGTITLVRSPINTVASTTASQPQNVDFDMNSTTASEPAWQKMSPSQSLSQSQPGMQHQQQQPIVPYPTPPLLTFTSSQVPPFLTGVEEVGPGWHFRDEDIVFFNSLLNTDLELEGNWDF